MEPKFLDTNIFIEILMRKGEKSDHCLKLLESGAPLWTTTLAFAEIEWVLRDFFEVPKERTIDLLKKILNYPNIEIENKKALFDSVFIYEQNNIDWTDCFNLAVLQREGQEEIYSYDKHFDKISGIKRREP